MGSSSALVACIVIIASIALAIADWQMLKRMLTIFGATVAQMAIVVAVVCVVNLTHVWWSYLLWFVLVLALSICWCLYPLQDKWRQMLWPVSLAMLAGSIVVGGSIILMLPISVFLSIYSVLMACSVSVDLFSTDGVYDGFAHADHDKTPDQPAEARGYARRHVPPSKKSCPAVGYGHPDALCRYAAGRRSLP